MYTKHGMARASQRGYPRWLIELASTFGRPEGDRLVLDNAILDEILCGIRKLRDKGGAVVVLDEVGRLVTVWNPETYRRPRQRARLQRYAEA
jgi:hypothetical protein